MNLFVEVPSNFTGQGGAGGIGTVYTEVLTDSGDHRTFTALHTIHTVLGVMNANSGKGLPAINFTISGTNFILSAPDTNWATDGIELRYA